MFCPESICKVAETYMMQNTGSRRLESWEQKRWSNIRLRTETAVCRTARTVVREDSSFRPTRFGISRLDFIVEITVDNVVNCLIFWLNLKLDILDVTLEFALIIGFNCLFDLCKIKFIDAELNLDCLYEISCWMCWGFYAWLNWRIR